MPAERALRNARLRWLAKGIRPSGRPRKMVDPAMAASRIVWVVDTGSRPLETWLGLPKSRTLARRAATCKPADRCGQVRAGMVAVDGSPAWPRNGRWKAASMERSSE